MWHNNRTVIRTYCSYHNSNAWASITGVAGGYKKIRAGQPHGSTNIFLALCDARANGRQVDVYIVANQIDGLC